jgi:hypothetical protein
MARAAARREGGERISSSPAAAISNVWLLRWPLRAAAALVNQWYSHLHHQSNGNGSGRRNHRQGYQATDSNITALPTKNQPT